MKKYICLMLVIMLICSGCGKGAPSGKKVPNEFRAFGECGLLVNEGELKNSNMVFQDEPIIFKDPVVEEMFRNMLGKPNGDVLHSELAKIHAIYWRGDVYYSNLQSSNGETPKEGVWNTKQPDTLEDFALCGNLQWLDIGGIEVPSLKPLCELGQLESLGFEGSVVTEERIEEISSLKTLKRLKIGNKDSTDWGGLTKGEFLLPLAENLVMLYAAGNIQWDGSVLKEMKNLEYLSIDDVEGLSFLKELTSLKKLMLYCPIAEDWRPLRECRNLEYLDITGNMKFEPKPDVTLEDLRSLEKLDYLSLGFTQLQEEHSRAEIIEALPNLTGLRLI